MNVFLFLYPIRQYIDFMLQRTFCDKAVDKQFEFFHRLIKERYRDMGYTVAWLLYCQEGDTSLIDQQLIHERISFHEDDLLINAGFPFSDQDDTYIYADNEYIFSQLPSDIRNLRVGGFHFSDCVDRVARYAYERLNLASVLVDEDLVESYWRTTAIMFDPLYADSYDPEDPRSTIPIHREMSYEGFGFKLNEDWADPDSDWNRVRRIRSESPWTIHK